MHVQTFPNGQIRYVSLLNDDFLFATHLKAFSKAVCSQVKHEQEKII